MQPLGLWQMMWDLGILSAIAVMMLLIIAWIIFLMFKPIEFFDKL